MKRTFGDDAPEKTITSSCNTISDRKTDSHCPRQRTRLTWREAEQSPTSQLRNILSCTTAQQPAMIPLRESDCYGDIGNGLGTYEL